MTCLRTFSQAVFLRSFPTVCCELLKIFSIREVANLARDTLSSLPTLTQTDCPLQSVKLQCMAKTVESPLYTNSGNMTFVIVQKNIFIVCRLYAHFKSDSNMLICVCV